MENVLPQDEIPHDKQHGRMGKPDLLSFKYTQLIAGVSLNDKSLSTLLVEVEGIFNSMTITCESTGDVNT